MKTGRKKCQKNRDFFPKIFANSQFYRINMFAKVRKSLIVRIDIHLLGEFSPLRGEKSVAAFQPTLIDNTRNIFLPLTLATDSVAFAAVGLPRTRAPICDLMRGKRSEDH